MHLGVVDGSAEAHVDSGCLAFGRFPAVWFYAGLRKVLLQVCTVFFFTVLPLLLGRLTTTHASDSLKVSGFGLVWIYYTLDTTCRTP